MINYQYKARDKAGKSIQGVMGADSERAVAAKLEQMGYLPIVISAVSAGESMRVSKVFEGFRRIKFSDLNLFTRQLYTLQKAGLPIIPSLLALKAQSGNPILKTVIEQMCRDIEAGANLSSALAKHPRVFNALYVNMVKSGEVSGQLVDVLQRLTALGEHEEKIKRQMVAAMRYPMMVVAALVIGFLALVTAVIPRFADLYSKSQVALPLPTQILVGINFMISHYWWLLIFLAAGAGWGVFKFLKEKKGQLLRDFLILKLPIMGPLVLKIIMARFCRITAMMMRSGVPILQILELVSGSTGNIVISKIIDDIKKSVNEGKGMLEPMRASGLIPPIVIQMVAIGEETGKVDELLLHVAEYYDEQIDYTIQNLVSLIEPILIFVLGIGMLFMALGIFMPMWNMINLFKK